ncbi:MAG TPA: glycosyltransferase family 39 protein [Candidatus Limnocylindrales bacterium]
MRAVPAGTVTDAGEADARETGPVEANAFGADAFGANAAGVHAGERPAGRLAVTIDGVTLVVLLAIAAVLRFVALPTRGSWDADQGHDMLVLTDLVRHGILPLLGPPTSIGAFHHGALYYYALAPAAWLGNGDPVAVAAEIALLGTAAVGIVWWTARSIVGTERGSIAGAAAGLAMAFSASAIDESTFIWNPNLIAFSAALSLAAAWRAWTTGRARWWILALAAQALTMQAHVLGAAFLPPLLVFLAADIVRGRAGKRAPFALAGLAGLAIVAASYVPLLAYELGHDFAESRAAIAFLASGGEPVSLDPASRLAFVGLRILAWPLAGLITDAPAVGVLAATVTLAALAWRLAAGSSRERSAARWIAAALVFCWLVLGLGVGGLATVTPLPVDHYHAFLDPLVFVVLGLGAAALWQRATGATRIAALGAFALLLAWQGLHWPPAVAPDGGWPAAEAAGERVAQSLGGSAVGMGSLPTFKTAEAYAFPLVRRGYELGATPDVDRVVIVCDALFVPDCGGPAESSVLSWPILDRFQAAPGRTITVFGRP